MSRLARETSGLFLGPMPTQIFLDKFLPLDGAPECPDTGECFADLGGKEKGSCELFVSMVFVSAPAIPC